MVQQTLCAVVEPAGRPHRRPRLSLVSETLAIMIAAGALGLTACTDSPANIRRVAPEDTVAPIGPVTSDRPSPNVAGAQRFIDSFIGMLSPREMGVCASLRAQPEGRQTIRRSFDIPPVHEQAARLGYSNDEFVDMVMRACIKRLDAKC